MTGVAGWSDPRAWTGPDPSGSPRAPRPAGAAARVGGPGDRRAASSGSRRGHHPSRGKLRSRLPPAPTAARSGVCPPSRPSWTGAVGQERWCTDFLWRRRRPGSCRGSPGEPQDRGGWPARGRARVLVVAIERPIAEREHGTAASRPPSIQTSSRSPATRGPPSPTTRRATTPPMGTADGRRARGRREGMASRRRSTAGEPISARATGSVVCRGRGEPSRSAHATGPPSDAPERPEPARPLRENVPELHVEAISRHHTPIVGALPRHSATRPPTRSWLLIVLRACPCTTPSTDGAK